VAGVVELWLAAPATFSCAGRLPALPGGFGETLALRVWMRLGGALVERFRDVHGALGDCLPGFRLGDADYVKNCKQRHEECGD
jgi:hypothetical protein